MSDILTKNVRDDELNTRLVYDIVRLDNWKNTCTRGVIGNRRVQRTIYSYDLTVLGWGFYSISLNDENRIETVLIIVLRTRKTVLRKLWINREDKSKSSQFIFTAIVVTRTMNYAVVVILPYI